MLINTADSECSADASRIDPTCLVAGAVGDVPPGVSPGVIWYATSGYHPDDVTHRAAAQPWYGHKTEPAFEDMLAKLRHTLIAARITDVHAAQPDPHIIRDYALACAAAAA